jgi:3-isopropylmalate/(R)-2-methylmalate dehydratase large subunit
VGQTVVEKILAKAAGRAQVAAGDFLEVSTPCPTVLAPHSAMDKGAGLITEWGAKVYDPTKIMIVDGHLGATASHGAAEKRRAMREWALALGVPEDNIYDLGRSGIENMIAVEKVWARPGECYFQGVNGHISTAGALGAFASALSYGTAAYLLRGTNWVKVPRSIKLVVQGQPREDCSPRDVSEFVLGQLGPSGAVGAVLEWTGPYVDGLSMDGRFAICSQALFTGAWTAIMNPDDTTLAYVAERVGLEGIEPQVSDSDADFADVLEFDVSGLTPRIIPPPTRHEVHDLKDCLGVKVNRGFIGSDANGWLPDLQLAARVLKGRKVKHDVILNVTPGTVSILKGALRSGALEILIDADCVVPTPNEGMEWGANTPLTDGDVCIATGQTNYPGRMGGKTSQIFLANPAVVAASCVTGEITDPWEFLGEEK